MNHKISSDDKKFKKWVEDCDIPVGDFDHRAHVRLAYIYLSKNNIEISVDMVRETLMRLLRYNHIEPDGKYHETANGG
jgi:hypothetical protein